MVWLKNHWQLLALTGVIFTLWHTPVILPLKLLVVVLHEVSHGIAAWATDGEIVSLTVSPDVGGLAMTRGGSRFAILSAGYLGSLLIGALLFWAALKTRADRWVMGLFGAALIGFAALFMRDTFALLFCIGSGAAMLVCAKYLPLNVNDLALRLIGLSNMIYVPYDIFSDTIARAHLRSDARMLSEEIGGPTVMWGALWLLISLIVIAACLRYALGTRSNIKLGGPIHEF